MKEHIEDIHAESQRLLRETRGVAFAPQPIIQKKSVQNVLEKIRSRKIQHLYHAPDTTFISDQHLGEVDVHTIEHVKATMHIMEEVSGDGSAKMQQFGHKDGQTTLDKNEDFPLRNFRSLNNHIDTNILRPPIENTQDFFLNSESVSDEHLEGNPVDIDYGAAGMGINLHLDSETQTEELDRWCEEDVNQEKCRVIMEQSIPHISETRAILKDFVDDEAEEDDDFRCESGDEDADIDGNVDDLIAPPEEEAATECSRRSKLHRKWLEQQEEALTDDILFRLRTGYKPRMCEDRIGSFLDENFGNSEAGDADNHARGKRSRSKVTLAVINSEQTNVIRAEDGSRMATLDNCNIIGADISEQSEPCEDEVEETIFRQRLLQKTEDQETFLSPVEDDASREVLGFISKLNVPPIKTKQTAGLSDMWTLANNTFKNAKSSFLGRAVSLSLPSSHKQGFGNSRSFIFGRDDSNNSHCFSGNENLEVTLRKDSNSNEGWNENPKRSEPPILAAGSTKISSGSLGGPSLFEILKHQASDLEQSLQERDTIIMEGKGHPLKNISIFSKSFKQQKSRRISE